MTGHPLATLTPQGGIRSNPNGPVKPRDLLNVDHPGFLYAEGKVLRILPHQPPQPFGSKNYIDPFDKNPSRATQEALNSHSSTDHIFIRENFPRDRHKSSEAPPSASAYLDIKGVTEAELKITHVAQDGDGCGAQVVFCEVKKPGGLTAYWNRMGHTDHPERVVAKIYDPLLYPKDHPIGPWIRLDTVSDADAEYAKEAAAYMEFHDHMDDPMVRDFVPRFYGTWKTLIKNEGWGSSTTPSVRGENVIEPVRPVNMILMEYINGPCLGDLCPEDWNQTNGSFLDTTSLVADGHDYSLDIFSRILRGLTALKFNGIRPEHLNAYSFIISEPDDVYKPSPKLQPFGDLRVVMINHDRSEVTRYTAQDELGEFLKRPLHPVCEEFDPRSLDCLAGVFPLEWRDDLKSYVDWANKTFRSEDFTCKDEAEEEFDKLRREWEEAKQSRRSGPAKKSDGEAKKSDGSDKKSQDSGPEYMTTSDYEPTPGLVTSVDTLDTLATSVESLRSLHPDQTSVPMDTGRQGEPTAKEAGRKAVEAGITTVMEQGGEGDDSRHDADDEQSPEEQSPEGKTGEKGGKDKKPEP